MMLARLYAQGREIRDLRRSYGKLLAAYHLEQERAAKAAQLLTEPCPMCEEMMRERDNAILDLDTAKADLDDLHAALAWLERDFKVK